MKFKETIIKEFSILLKGPTAVEAIFFLHPSPNVELHSIVDDSLESISAHEFLEERLKAIKLY